MTGHGTLGAAEPIPDRPEYAVMTFVTPADKGVGIMETTGTTWWASTRRHKRLVPDRGVKEARHDRVDER